MDIQAAVSLKKNRDLIGTILRVMIDGIDFEAGRYICRSQAHAPEVDGVVYIDEASFNVGIPPNAGDMLTVKITGASDYDLIGETLNG